MPIQFKQKCSRCRSNYVLTTRRDRYPVCYDCDKRELVGEITDENMKVLFDIPEDHYRNNPFLRDIKKNYLRYGQLTEKQVDAFKKAVARMQEASEENLDEDQQFEDQAPEQDSAPK